MKTKVWQLIVAAACLAGGVQAHELYTNSTGTIVKWPALELTLQGASDQFIAGSALRDAMSEAVDAWNLNPSPFRLYIEYDAASYEIDNDVSEVWFESDTSLLDEHPAITYFWYNSRAEITEADIFFDATKTWATSHLKTDTDGYGGDRSIQTLGLHELGHSMGLDHENDEYNIMGEDWTHVNANYTRLNFYPGEDACNGIVALYGLDSTPREDVSVVHWKYDSADGEYSEHIRTRVYDDTGTDFSYHTDDAGEPIYAVSAGAEVYMEVTLENSGTSTQHPKTKFYFSENSLITTWDTVLASRTPGLGRNDVYTITQLLVIPTTVTTGGTYYLGVIVDCDNAIDEINDQNNATYIGIYIK